MSAEFPLEILPESHTQFKKVIGNTLEPNWLGIYQMNKLLYNGWKASKPVSTKGHKQISGRVLAKKIS